MMQEIGEIVKTRLDNAPAPERRRRLLSLVMMPDVHSDRNVRFLPDTIAMVSIIMLSLFNGVIASFRYLKRL